MEVAYCSRCHLTDVPMIKYSRQGERQYYHCRDCNSQRMREYFKTSYGKKNVQKAIKKTNDKFPERLAARSALNGAVYRGTIIKPKACSVCLTEKKRIEGHHYDYSKPYDVMWVCSGCHADMERV